MAIALEMGRNVLANIVLMAVFSATILILGSASAIAVPRNMDIYQNIPPYDHHYINDDKAHQWSVRELIKTKLDLIEHLSTKYRKELIQARKEVTTQCGSLRNVNTIYCEACELFVDGAKALLQQGATAEDLEKFALKACIDFQIEDDKVCSAVVVEFKDELIGVLIELAYTPKEVCGFILGKDCGAPFNPIAMWNVTFPYVPKPPVVPPAPPKPGSPTLKVLHITDMHLDPVYMEGTNAECGEPVCCRPEDGFPGPGPTAAGKYGDYRNCDTAAAALDNLFEYFNSIQDQFDYIVFTGDLPPHYIWNQSRADQLTSLSTFTNYMLKYLPNKKVYSAMGNHESAPVNSFPPPFITGNNSESWLYQAAAESWLHWLPQETSITIEMAGYYTVKPYPGLRIISLNMNMCNNLNWWLYINTTDPAGMLQWFISELQDAEIVGDKVHVLGHIDPGSSDCLKPWSWNYYKIVNRYESTIVGQFFGHDHSDTFKMFYDEETMTRPLGVAYIPGSITTYSYLNPGFRIYEIDGNYTGASWIVQDYTNYYLNLTSANMYGNPVWQMEYNAKEAYGLTSLFPQDWNELIYKMKTDDRLFQTFCIVNMKSAPNTCDQCNADCRKGYLCSLKTGRSGDPKICNDL